MRAGCQVGTKADELLQGAPRVPPSEVLPLPDTPDTPKKDIDRLERVQQRAARFVFNDYKPLSSVTSMVSQLGWKPLAERRREHRLSLLYKIINGLVAMPADTHLHINTRNTRISNSKSLELTICTTDTFKHSFFPATIRDLNLLPDDIVNCKNMSPFKETIRKSRD